MELKTILSILSGILFLGIYKMVQENKKKSAKIEIRKRQKALEAKAVKSFNNSEESNHPISNSIITLLESISEHEDVHEKLNSDEIEEIEKQLSLKLPQSYKIFLKHFGDGGSYIFYQSIDAIQNYSWLKDYRDYLGETIQLDNEVIAVNSLLCLMTEDSNGGAWCWLTQERNKNNEWPLAYYINNKLNYKVENFTAWLKILSNTKSEVIRALDIEEELGLG